ncbi:hypothetical protein [Paenibacillus piri]|uniref:DUF2158 domain-containing protein n=1 Tax=Paenibacillus piri TaxID=2547395 RepID=A0A4R5KW82_9BACL|nr:hypothetical protein [Paenibacillus piri]TDG00254.1 hypothetical protein E1757_01020 [Paenibacillus piri]
MLKIGDYVVFSPDGARGIIMEVRESLYHVVWEDHFSSWEKGELLKQADVTKPARQDIEQP